MFVAAITLGWGPGAGLPAYMIGTLYNLERLTGCDRVAMQGYSECHHQVL